LMPFNTSAPFGYTLRTLRMDKLAMLFLNL
jgi:hypothetical protein